MTRSNVEDEVLFEELYAARRDLLTVLEGLGPNDWDKQTLCERWHVRDVVSHLAVTPEMTRLRSFAGKVRSRGDRSMLVDEQARELGERPVAEILEHFRRNVESSSLPPKLHVDELLVDVVIHSLDICEPNGWELNLPVDRLRRVLSTLVTLGGPFGGKRRAEGLHFDTTDIDWRCGCGDHVRGPSKAMLLALAGRTPMCEQLTGEGVGELASRH